MCGAGKHVLGVRTACGRAGSVTRFVIIGHRGFRTGLLSRTMGITSGVGRVLRENGVSLLGGTRELTLCIIRGMRRRLVTFTERRNIT